jgi:hypothetical protein
VPFYPYQEEPVVDAEGPPYPNVGRKVAIAGIILGIAAFLLVPPLFGLGGIACGGVAIAKHERRLGVVAIVVALVAATLGFVFLGASQPHHP